MSVSASRCIASVIFAFLFFTTTSSVTTVSARADGWSVDWSAVDSEVAEPRRRSVLGSLHDLFGAARGEDNIDDARTLALTASDAHSRPPSRATVSFGQYFGDPSGTPDFSSNAGFAADPGHRDFGEADGQWTFIDLPTDNMRSIHSIQFGGFRVGGLGAGVQSSTETIGIERTRKIAAVVGECGRIISPATTITVFDNEEVAAASDESEDFGGVEFNLTFKDMMPKDFMPGFRTFAGARFLTIGNNYSGTTQAGFSNDGGGRSGDYAAAEVTNRLMGAQFGVIGRKLLSRDLMVTGRLAFGAFANLVENNATYLGGNSSFDDQGTESRFAQMIEFSPTLHVRLEKNMFLSFGGTLMWLNGISQVPDSPAAALRSGGRYTDDDSSYLYYGAKTTFRWNFE